MYHWLYHKWLGPPSEQSGLGPTLGGLGSATAQYRGVVLSICCWGWDGAKVCASLIDGAIYDVVDNGVLSALDIYFNRVQASLLPCLFEWRVMPCTLCCFPRHHVCNLPGDPVVKGRQSLEEFWCDDPGLAGIQQYCLHDGFVEHAYYPWFIASTPQWTGDHGPLLGRFLNIPVYCWPIAIVLAHHPS